jgi:hypothetical protein
MKITDSNMLQCEFCMRGIYFEKFECDEFLLKILRCPFCSKSSEDIDVYVWTGRTETGVHSGGIGVVFQGETNRVTLTPPCESEDSAMEYLRGTLSTLLDQSDRGDVCDCVPD